ncbi:MAG: RagB/SusD family nutrient uptake outer membrane protein [Dysgonamonadaceae bacterium]|jgi:hypothetical protein|nr:RagB/SusD family nutrient uptake outer membrane protein [Dysgonamonadaceae bacterium]
MKQINFIIAATVAAATMCFTACNDSFLQQDPTQQMAEGSFLVNESDLPLYLNQFYASCYDDGNKIGYIEGMGASYAETSTITNAPFGDALRGPRLIMWDKMTDNALMNGTNRSANNTGVADPILNETFVIPQSGTITGWDWKGMRSLNYFLRNYTQAAKDGDISSLDRWKAEALFFKAWDYFNKVLIFGEVPWYETDLNVNSEELYAPRTPRVQLMDSVLSIINFAVAHLPDNNTPDGRINKDMANFLKMRICLFEGTFRKYHAELSLPDANKFLTECVNAAEAIIASGHYSLYKSDADKDVNGNNNSYWKMFTFRRTPKTDGNTEAILARTYDGANVGNATFRYFDQNQPKKYGCFGASKGFLDEYLCIDGKSISESPLFEGYDGWWSELENRDPRLTQTVCRPGEYWTIWRSSGGTKGIIDRSIHGITYPVIGSTVNASTVGGYRVIKHWVGDITEYEASWMGTQTGVEFRYAEVLVSLAEAKAELGTISQSDLDRTINTLRERAGFNFATYPNSKLALGNEPSDPRLDAIYSQYVGYVPSAIIREIRRERRVEMAWEGLRYADLIRWKAGKLMTVPLRGMKMTPEKQAMYATKHDLDPSHTDHSNDTVISTAVVINSDYYLDSEGFIICYPRDPKVSSGALPWSDKRYYWPIPKQEIELNKNLTQSPGWE